MTNGQGNRIREFRKRNKMTQTELADKMGVTKQTISKYEKELITNIRSDVLELMADALHVTPMDILGWEDLQKKNDAIADIVVKLREDDDFRELVHAISKLDKTQIAGVKQLLNAFM